MRRYFLIIFILSLVFFISCAKKESIITIKAGVVMKSGDVKNVARQEFLITNTDVISFWEASKKEHMKGLELIEKEIKAELDYENKMNNFKKEKDRYRSIVARKTARNNPQVSKMVDDLKANFNKSNEVTGSAETFTSDIEILGKEKTSYNEIKEIMNRQDLHYKFLVDLWEESIKSVHMDWIKQYEEFKKIKILVDNFDNQIKGERNNIYKINQGINELKKELDLKVQNKFLSLKNKTINEFQLKLKENLVQSFKTNLVGEASFTLEKRKYYIFGLVAVGINNIIWNLPLDVTEDTQYLELSNDNAYALSNQSLFEELLEALMGIGTVE